MVRLLTAILAVDVFGYSRLMEADEEGTLSTLKSYRHYIDARVGHHSGRVFGSAGDSVIAQFSSPVEAVRCAVDIQKEVEERNAALPENKRMLFRIGVNFGDVMEEDNNLHGDGVNVAARLETLASPGGICISKQVAELVAGKVDVTFANAGDHDLKNISKPVEIWIWPPERAKKMRRAPKTWRAAAVIAGLTAIVGGAVYVATVGGQVPDLPTGPRIALIPFTTVGNDPKDAFFSEGLTRDINAQLSKFSNLFIIAPEANAAFGDNPDCNTIRVELQADYILTGSVRRSTEQLRVTTAFMDAKTCLQLNSPGPFDRDSSLASVLDIQLEIARKVAAEVGSGDAPVFSAEVERTIFNKAPESLEAYECVMLSYWFYKTFDPDRHRKARDCLKRTLAADPGYSLGWSRLAFSYIESKKRSIDTLPDWAELAKQAINRAIELDRDNPDAFYARAILSRMIGEDQTIFWNNAQKAIELNPNDAWILADLGTWLAYSGEWEKGNEWVARSKALNPKQHPGFTFPRVLHHYLKSEYREARDLLLKIMTPGSKSHMGFSSLAAIYAKNEEQQKAEEALARVLELQPNYPEDPRAPFRARGMPTELVEKLMDGLRKAGLDVPPEASED